MYSLHNKIFYCSTIDYTYEGKTSFRHQSQNLIALVVQYLFHNKKLWNVQCVILNSRTPIAKVLHIPSKLICDISVSNGLAVENTKMIK
jgi:DNA polymerase sigma